jgi:hypothetical protein
VLKRTQNGKSEKCDLGLPGQGGTASAVSVGLRKGRVRGTFLLQCMDDGDQLIRARATIQNRLVTVSVHAIALFLAPTCVASGFISSKGPRGGKHALLSQWRGYFISSY